LKSFEGADGLKTGFICDSGFNVVASATREGKRLMAVVLGEQTGSDRTLRAASLLEHGFQQLGWKQIFNTTTIDNLPIAAEAKGITSMRQSVVSWECGTGRRSNSVAAARKAKLKAAKAAKAKKEQSAGLANGATPTDGGAKPAAKPATAVTGQAKPVAADAPPKPAQTTATSAAKPKISPAAPAAAPETTTPDATTAR
jgi:D-alanyl-D-alanine carboxypeptidase